MSNYVLGQKEIAEIQAILDKGNSVELKPRRDDIIILEVKRKLKVNVPRSV